MSSTPYDRLESKYGWIQVDAETIDGFLADGPARAVLMFAGDPNTRPEAQDLAVILPQVLAPYGGSVKVGVVGRKDEAALKARFGVVVLPTLVFLEGTEDLGVIPRLQDWAVYQGLVEGLLGNPAPLAAE